MVLGHNISEGTRTQDVTVSADVTFDSLFLSNITLKGLEKSGFYKPSPIQLHAIPLGKCGFDVFLEAKSGTGKTAVFTVMALEMLDLTKGLQVIILAPTREIAAQITDVIEQIGVFYEGLNVAVVMGGLPIEEDVRKLQSKVHILVGSPGRMRHLLQSNHIDVKDVKMLVLDEADKLMSKSFLPDIEYIFSLLDGKKQVIMSSATYPSALKALMKKFVEHARHVCPDSTSVLIGIKQLVTTVKSNVNIVRQTQNKFRELMKIFSNHEFKQCLIFCNYQARIGELCTLLKREKWPADQLHGQLEQNERLGALKTLQEYKCRILVSTDLAARGIDASNVDLVINFEPPYDWQTYLHRIGRAGRFGSYGIAITILSEGKEITKFKEMITKIGHSVKINYLWSGDLFQFNDADKSAGSMQQQIKKEKSDHLEVDNPQLEEADITKVVEVKYHLDTEVITETESKETSDTSRLSELLEIQDDKNAPTILRDPTETPVHFKIESFNDLMTSFEVYEFNNEIIDMEDDSLDSMINIDKATETQANILLEICTNPDGVIEVRNSRADTAKREDVTQNPTSYDHEQISENPSEVKTSSVYQDITLNGEERDKEDYLILSDISEALRNAGLPTAFGSTKRSNNNTGNLKVIKDYRPISSYEKTCNQSKNHSPQSIRRDYSLQSNNSKDQSVKRGREASVISFEDDGYNTHSCLHSRSTKDVQSRYVEENRTIDDETLDMEITSDVYRNNYIKWYTQFKKQMKQIEMSLYMNELSTI